MLPATAKEAGLILCHHCRKLTPVHEHRAVCSRCGFSLHIRKPNSVERTWAWTIAAMITFIPANLLPTMNIYTLGAGEADTIISGILKLIQYDMVPVAVIVFIASFLVPLGKILGLIILLVSVQHHSNIHPEQRSRLYHLVEFLGPWSMLDVFVVSIMAAVVNLGFITSIDAGAGITFFAIMVVFTMIAAGSFDPRLIWDEADSR